MSPRSSEPRRNHVDSPAKPLNVHYNPKASQWTCEEMINSSVLSFHKRLPNYAQTPLHRLPRHICREIEVAEVLVKDESNRFGLPAFKILGASWASYCTIAGRLGLPLTCDLEELRKTARQKNIFLFTATDGNHGRAVARIASILGVQAKVYVPKIMAEMTKQLIGGEGAEVIVANGDYDEAVRQADKQSHESGGFLIQDMGWTGYEEVPKWIIEGYSTMMTEIDQQISDTIGKAVDLVITPVGVGSLAQATISHYKTPSQNTAILAVEPDNAACLKASREKGEITTIITADTIMCGMNCGTVSSTAWPYLRDGIDACLTVNDEEAQQAQITLKDCMVDVGPCGAATFAALTKVCRYEREPLGISKDSVIVLLATEGPR